MKRVSAAVSVETSPMTRPGDAHSPSCPVISVVVCTRNRSQYLRRALSSLIGQTLDPRAYEIVVVDNGSTDGTGFLLASLAGQAEGRTIRVVPEEVPGLSRARNAGAEQARGQFVAFLDDDAQASPEWLSGILRCFSQVEPTPVVVGGRIVPSYESDKPSWFKDTYEERSWGMTARFLRRGETLSGSNMAFPREALLRSGGFDPAFGVRGETLRLGEETDLLLRLWDAHAGSSFLYYDPDLVVAHAVPRHKMTLGYRAKRMFVGGQTSMRQGAPRGFGRRALHAPRLGVTLVLSVGRALWALRQYPCWQNWWWEAFAPVFVVAGRLAECLSLNIPLRQRARGGGRARA